MKNLLSGIVLRIRRNALLRKSVILIWHIAGICITYYVAFLLRFDGIIPPRFLRAFQVTVVPLVVLCVGSFALFRLYSGIWAYFSMHDAIRILSALALAFVGFVPAVFAVMGGTFANFPRSTIVIEFLLLAAWMNGGRLAVRWIRECCYGRKIGPAASGSRALIVGNIGDVDHLIYALAAAHPEIGAIVGVVTDDTARHRLTLRGIPVRGPVAEIGGLARGSGADCILILSPYTRPGGMKRIVAACEAENVACDFRMMPSLADLAAGKMDFSTIRRVELEDLLGRPEIAFDRAAVREMIAGKSVVVTGAGGSIGSELVRQIAEYAPGALVLLDNNELNLYSIDLEIRGKKPGLSVVGAAGDIGNRDLVRKILRERKVELVFHAAAYKHVPIMETNVPACVANNAIGTARLAAEAEEAGVRRFVLVSTDKAVRPTSVMGASKRLAERVVQERPSSGTAFVIVRFGNVLGSSGSVIPLFRRQIEAGGPVTVTSEKATRFFMSIPEAVDLILQASVIGNDRDIMVLEMGESIRIVDLARHMIELSGLHVGDDIAIAFTGLRPGEKEYEEVMTDGEDVVRTPFEKIWVMRRQGAPSAPAMDLDRLARLVAAQDDRRLREELAHLIPEAAPTLAMPQA
ncbi:MAG: nucleoside-diphosphate sugar epimerase/dehydratase [Verrucomicrobiota bacterium]|nr:nucleoside-diphosphate sugar epimerase/dehydratase [Verrucomicrobiota bacterium]